MIEGKYFRVGFIYYLEWQLLIYLEHEYLNIVGSYLFIQNKLGNYKY